ncbi:MAG: hypothetical protein JWM04_2762 [Verrucomicrobiales bacterium]|nr:hypothetical protein [Verrucomicrobiales bacterium]
MKTLTVIIVALALVFGVMTMFEHYQKLKAEEKEGPAKKRAAEAAAQANVVPPGMPYELESKYVDAQNQGAVGIKNFLAKYGKRVRDPRLAAVQLDYVVLVASKDVAEARRVFAEVKKRTGIDSVNYDRVQQLAKTYE